MIAIANFAPLLIVPGIYVSEGACHQQDIRV
jgi:hypothetical protein